MRTFKYRTKLAKATHASLDDFLEQQRLLYNAALQERIDCYAKTGKSISFSDQCKSLTEIRREDVWFSQYHVGSQRSALNRLDKAYKRFFAHGGFPRFKARGRIRSFDASGIKPTFGAKYGSIKIKGIGRIRWRHDARCRPDDIKLGRIVKYPNGVYVQVMCEGGRALKGLDGVIGIDVGVKARAVLSDGAMIPKRMADTSNVKRLQRAVARAKKGSTSRRKKVKMLNKAHHRLKVRNFNDLHQITTAMVRHHGKWIAVEDLQIQNMTAAGGALKRGMTRSIMEQNWGIFTQQLAYKAESAGGKLVKVNPRNTTQQCSNCGGLPQVKLTLKDRYYYCVHCGHNEDRDINAAKNIAQRGIEALLSGGNFPDAQALFLPDNQGNGSDLRGTV